MCLKYVLLALLVNFLWGFMMELCMFYGDIEKKRYCDLLRNYASLIWRDRERVLYREREREREIECLFLIPVLVLVLVLVLVT